MDLDKIKNNINKLNKLQEYKLILVQEEIEYIINNNIIDNNKIESLLDDLLNIMYSIYNDDVVNLYIMLCNYYLSINPKSARDYIYFYYKDHAPKDKMNIIFLDIDGVLNSDKYFYTYRFKLDKLDKMGLDDDEYLIEWAMLRIDPIKVMILKEIVDKTNAKVVITSSWKSLNYFGLVEDRLRDAGIPIIDETKDENYNRGYGIKQYVEDNNIHNYIVIDDDIFDDYDDEILNRLVKTSFKDGLTEKYIDLAVEKLNKEDLHKKKVM